MKKLVISLILFYLVHQNSADDTTYTTRYDGIDLDEILSNDRLLNGYINCLLETGGCTPDGRELKHNLPDAIQNDCKKCTQRQKEGADKVMHYIIDHRPDDWVKLEEKYDSDGTYKNAYLESKTSQQKDKDDEHSNYTSKEN